MTPNFHGEKELTVARVAAHCPAGRDAIYRTCGQLVLVGVLTDGPSRSCDARERECATQRCSISAADAQLGSARALLSCGGANIGLNFSSTATNGQYYATTVGGIIASALLDEP